MTAQGIVRVARHTLYHSEQLNRQSKLNLLPLVLAFAIGASRCGDELSVCSLHVRSKAFLSQRQVGQPMKRRTIQANATC